MKCRAKHRSNNQSVGHRRILHHIWRHKQCTWPLLSAHYQRGQSSGKGTVEASSFRRALFSDKQIATTRLSKAFKVLKDGISKRPRPAHQTRGASHRHDVVQSNWPGWTPANRLYRSSTATASRFNHSLALLSYRIPCSVVVVPVPLARSLFLCILCDCLSPATVPQYGLRTVCMSTLCVHCGYPSGVLCACPRRCILLPCAGWTRVPPCHLYVHSRSCCRCATCMYCCRRRLATIRHCAIAS